MFKVIPGILEQEWQVIENEIKKISLFSSVIHLDIIDGKFVDNLTFLDPQPFSKYTSDILFEVHLMVEEPAQYLESFAKAGFKRFIAQVEKMSDQSAYVKKASSFGEVGLALDGPTPLSMLKVPWESLDVIILFTGEQIGFSKGTLKEERLSKLTSLAKSVDKSFPLEADGGINEQTILLAKNAGASRFVSTGFIKSGDYKDQYDKLNKLL